MSKEIAVAVFYRNANAFAPAGMRLKTARAAPPIGGPDTGVDLSIIAWDPLEYRFLRPIPGSLGLRTVAA